MLDQKCLIVADQQAINSAILQKNGWAAPYLINSPQFVREEHAAARYVVDLSAKDLVLGIAGDELVDLGLVGRGEPIIDQQMIY